MAAPGIYERISALIRQGRVREAQATLTPLLLKHPRDPEVLAAGANVTLNSGKHQDALNFAQRAIEADPNSGSLWTTLGIAHLRLKHWQPAESAFREALRLVPSDIYAMASLIAVIREQDRLEEAVQLGIEFLKQSNDSDEVANALLAAESMLDPEKAYAHGKEIIGRIGMSPVLTLSMALYGCYCDSATQTEILEYGQAFGEALVNQGRVSVKVNSKLDPSAKPVIGLVSSDFRSHAVANFLMPLVKALKLLGYKVIGYQYAGVSDEVTDRFRKLIPIRMFLPRQEHEVIDQLLKDRVEMLFDLNGYTAGGFQALFVQGVCPCIVHYLGFPNTVGMPGLRWRLVDSVTDLHEGPEGYSERLVKMAPPFLCFEPFVKLPELLERTEKRPLTLASFNNFMKISRFTAELWAEAMRAVPESKLVLKSTQSSIPDMRRAILERFAGLGVEDRIEFWERSATVEEHLARYNEVDIALDPYPYHGTTTTCDALSMGVPVVTLSGPSHRCRVGTALVGSAPELGVVAGSREEFVKGVRSLAADRRSRESVREAFLRGPVCDVEGFAHRLAPVLERIWSEACAGD